MRLMRCLLVASLLLGLSACGDKAENQGGGSSAVEAQSSDPRYQNALLNANPEQFSQILADCGKLMFGEHQAPEEVQVKCRQDMISRASSIGLTISEHDIAEQLVKDRYQFMQRDAK